MSDPAIDLSELTPTGMYGFVSRGNGLISRTIAWTTAPLSWILFGRLRDVPTHCGVGFVYPGGREVYFHAHAGDHWTGPHDIEQFRDWLRVDEDHWARRYFIAQSPDQMRHRYQTCLEKRDEWTYNISQFRWIYLHRRLGVSVPSSPKHVVCSEAVARILHPDFLRPHKAGARWIKPDEATPMDIMLALERASISQLEMRRFDAYDVGVSERTLT
ncbi:MAG: hypothetical protein OES34_11645 [Nitrosopumilus sp.]|nr:hypothetical protein [Nitrosopumilus sp.]